MRWLTDRAMGSAVSCSINLYTQNGAVWVLIVLRRTGISNRTNQLAKFSLETPANIAHLVWGNFSST